MALRRWDMGHRPGKGYAELHARYMAEEISLSELLNEYHHPANYQPELPKTNRSHRFQGH